MAGSARSNAAWEKVLAAIEADAAKAAALLLDETGPTAATPAATNPDARNPPVTPRAGVRAQPDTSTTAAEVDAAIAESLGESLESRRRSPGGPQTAAGRTAYIPASAGAPARFQRPAGRDAGYAAAARYDPAPGYDPALADDAALGYDAVPGLAVDSPVELTGDEPAPAVPAAQPTPATWRLPANPEAFALELPDPADMPPIPEELRERIERLHTRIEALKSDLAKALAQARNAPARPVRMTQPTTAPGFVDRKL